MKWERNENDLAKKELGGADREIESMNGVGGADRTDRRSKRISFVMGVKYFTPPEARSGGPEVSNLLTGRGNPTIETNQPNLNS